MDVPWQGDAVSLVEAFRRKERSPVEEIEASLAAVERSRLNAMSHVDGERALATARTADVSDPFGGVPVGVKELDRVAGWPDTQASVALSDEVAEETDTRVQRLEAAGSVLVGLTTSSEFGGTNQTFTKLNGATRNPWNLDRTPGGSSGGSAAGVAGGLFPLGTGGDGAGSVRGPAGFCGLLGLKCTRGRTPLGPHVGPGAYARVAGCLTRSVRDTARWLDVTNGFHARDPFSLPRVDGWERNLGHHVPDLKGKRAALVVDIGNAVVAPEVAELVTDAAEDLIRAAGLRRVPLDARLPEWGEAWDVAGGLGPVQALGERWPACAGDLTEPTRRGVEATLQRYDARTAAMVERQRIAINEAMSTIFEHADVVIAATNPDVAFGATDDPPTVFGGLEAEPINHDALTVPSNLYGNPAVSLPVGTSSDGLPIGMQVLSPHFTEQWLLDLAWIAERERPWPLAAPGAPR